MDKLMTRKEKEKILLDGLGLNVGDVIEYKNEKYTIIEEDDHFAFNINPNSIQVLLVGDLTFVDFKKVENLKKYKDMTCIELGLNCSDCPLEHICSCSLDITHTVQEQLDKIKLDDKERKFYQNRINAAYEETSKEK